MNEELKPTLPNCAKLSSKPSLFCPGCGHSIILKNLGFVIDEMKIAKKTVVSFDIGCSLLAWNWFDLNSLQTHHGRTVSFATGFKEADKNRVVIAYQGDGGAYAIGWQGLYYAALKNKPITAFIVNNTVYAMTGGQTAPTTICDEKTTTAPEGLDCLINSQPFLGPEILAKVANKNAYIARTSMTNPLQMKIFIEKAIKNQIENNSFSLVEILSICPTNWRTGPKESLDFVSQKMRPVFPLGVVYSNEKNKND